MFALALALATLAGSADPTTHVVKISPTDVAYFHVGDVIPNGQLDLFVVYNDGSTLLTEFDEMWLVDGVIEVVMNLGENPTIFRTSYTDAQGDVHEIITNCGRYPANDAGSARCAEEHRRSIAAIKKLFPKEINRETDVDFEQIDEDRDVRGGTGGVVILPIRKAA